MKIPWRRESDGYWRTHLEQSSEAFLTAAWGAAIAAGATADLSGTSQELDLSEVFGEISITLEIGVPSGFAAFVDVEFLVSKDGTVWDTHAFHELEFDVTDGSLTTRRLTMELNKGAANKIKVKSVTNNDAAESINADTMNIYLSQMT